MARELTFLVTRSPKRRDNRDGEDGDNDDERGGRTDLDPVGCEHLDGGEGEHSSQAVVQEAQPGERGDDEEVERAQSHHRHDVGGVGKKRLARDGEHGRDGVERKDDVGEFDGDEGEEKQGCGGAAILEDDEAVLAQADGMEAF